jgi:glycosyltransferase involved in cell wall biosynthesis
MRVLLVGRMDGWMTFYLSQLEKGFLAAGAECRTHNYRKQGLGMMLKKALSLGTEASLKAERTNSVVEAVRAFLPDIVLTNSGRLDLTRIREALTGVLVYWDMDGPDGLLVDQAFPWADGVDLVLTVSRPLERRFSQSQGTLVHYLPHGADLEFYSRGPVSETQHTRFAAQITFVGRVSKRREALLERLVDCGLAVWGEDWGSRNVGGRIKGCLREKGDVVGEDVVALYRSSDVVLNILRDPFMSPPSILSVQAFTIPATGACLLSDWVEELEDAFEPDREVLAFSSADELVEKANRYTRDRAACRQVGEAGRRRCEADHSLTARARRILELSNAVR